MKKFFIGLIIVLVAVFATGTFVMAQENLLVAEGKFNSLIGGELFTLLLEIKTIQLRGDIFDTKAFSNLKDFGTPLTPQPVGRENPFLEI